MPYNENSSLYGEALMRADVILGGNARVDDKFTSALFFLVNREPSAEVNSAITSLAPNVDRENASFMVGQNLSRDQVMALNAELNPLNFLDQAQRRLSEEGLDIYGALTRNLQAVKTMVQSVLGRFDIDGYSPMSIKEIRALAGLPPLEPIDVSEDLRSFRANLETAVGGAIDNNVTALRNAFEEVSRSWPASSEKTRAIIQKVLLEQAQAYADAVLPGMNLADTKMDVMTHAAAGGGYQILKLNGDSIISIPKSENIKVPVDVFMLAHEGRTGHDLTARLAREAVCRGMVPQHRNNGLMFTSSVGLEEGYAQCHAATSIAKYVDASFFNSIGITAADVEIFMQMVWLRDAAKSHAAFLASEGLSAQQISDELTKSIPIIMPNIIKFAELHAAHSTWSALYGSQYRDGKLVIDKATQQWGLPETLKKIVDIHDVVSLEQELKKAI